MMRGWRGIWSLRTVVAIATAAAFTALAAWGGEGSGTTTTAPAAESNVPQGVFELWILGGGFIGFIIIACSIIAVALGIEFYVANTREKLIPEDLLADVENALDNQQYEEAVAMVENNDNMLARILYAGLSKMGQGVERMESAMAEEADAQATILYQKLGWINTIAGVAPMLGLYGTVQGMIKCFQQIALSNNPTAQDLAGGIFVALVTTFQGLTVAIPCLLIFTFFRGRMVKLMNAMSLVMGEILDRFRQPAEGQ
ncbi:MAG: MotA/TolQ/ExbB proton channel family protein [Planctomycetota bacterium]|nr:MotA/TolQ/ExbB proton channel family protein [Planctomycetota bacterium]